MNLQGSFIRSTHRAAKFTRSEVRGFFHTNEVSFIPTMISLEGVCVVLQFVPYSIAGLYFSTVKLHIPPIFVKYIIGNMPHHSKCLFDAWNVVGQDSSSSCGRPRSFTCPHNTAFSMEKDENGQSVSSRKTCTSKRSTITIGTETHACIETDNANLLYIFFYFLCFVLFEYIETPKIWPNNINRQKALPQLRSKFLLILG